MKSQYIVDINCKYPAAPQKTVALEASTIWNACTKADYLSYEYMLGYFKAVIPDTGKPEEFGFVESDRGTLYIKDKDISVQINKV